MKRFGAMGSLACALGGCPAPTTVLGAPEAQTSGIVTTTESSTGGNPAPDLKLDLPPDGQPGCDADLGNCNKIDLLFVIDNSGTMAEEQLNLAKNFPLLVDQLENLQDKFGNPVGADVHIMVTTTDFGNPRCTSFQKHEPEKGAPIYTGCNQRIDRFTGLGEPPDVREEACTDVCPVDIEPADQFIHLTRNGSNVPDVPPNDVNGDGIEDSPVAQALACIGPQGIDGCGYESPLETMLQALNPNACWNAPHRPECESDPDWAWLEEPFLRDDALLAIAVITDEVDCSVRDWAVMSDPDFQETDPSDGKKKASSAVCWNAGVECTGFDAVTGEFAECHATNRDLSGNPGVSDSAAVLHAKSRYIDYLASLQKNGKKVIMLGILGVPEVTAHALTPPFQPIAGGVADLVYRKWRTSDLIDPFETPEEKMFEFGIGPGCTGYVEATMAYTGQAIPPVRVKEVCQSLDLDGEIRCCIESICDDDFSAALRCLTGLIREVIPPAG